MNVVLSRYSKVRVSHVNAQEPIYYVSGSLCGGFKMSAVQIGGGGNNVGSGNNIVGQLVVATNSSGVATTSSGGMATSEIRQML